MLTIVEFVSSKEKFKIFHNNLSFSFWIIVIVVIASLLKLYSIHSFSSDEVKKIYCTKIVKVFLYFVQKWHIFGTEISFSSCYYCWLDYRLSFVSPVSMDKWRTMIAEWHSSREWHHSGRSWTFRLWWCHTIATRSKSPFRTKWSGMVVLRYSFYG